MDGLLCGVKIGLCNWRTIWLAGDGSIWYAMGEMNNEVRLMLCVCACVCVCIFEYVCFSV